MQAGIEEQSALYQKRIPIFPRTVRGPFRTFKTGIVVLAWTVFFGLVWLPWSRTDGASQAVLLDIANHQFHFLGLTVFPQDALWFAMLMFIAATLLFFVTAMVGRAFCGYFCFQTLWTDVFIWVERLVQGDRPARTRLYKQPWNREKLAKLGITHLVWLLIAFWTAFTFAAYFTYAPELLRDFFTGHANYAAYLTIGILTASTYVAAGLAREQVCTYICPYARFQAVMYDPETLVVSYDERRGDSRLGRASLRAGTKGLDERRAAGYGDCIDCTLCVQVCPVGIDIRNGFQYPCISCGLCIDACNGVMDSIGFPRGLIRYDSEVNMKRATPAPVRLDWKRLKVLGYGLALLAMTIMLVVSISSRGSFDQTVTQIRQPLFVLLSDGRISNRYQIRISNKTAHEETYVLGVRGIPTDSANFGNFQRVLVKPGHSLLVQASIKLPSGQHATDFDFSVLPLSNPKEIHYNRARFYAQGAE